MDEKGSKRALEENLKELAKVAQQYPPMSLERNRALDRLCRTLLKKNIFKNTFFSFNTNSYDIYQEAIQKTLLEVCQKIDMYAPEYSFINWVNQCLKWRYLELIRKTLSQEKSMALDESVNLPIFEENSRTEQVQEEVREFIKKDPENLLKNVHLRQRPDITFQKLVWMKYVDDKSWSEISEELNIPVSSLYSFFSRNFHEFRNYFIKYLES